MLGHQSLGVCKVSYSYISPLITYCLRHLLCCLQTCKYDQSLSIMDTYILTKIHVDIWLPLMGVESEQEVGEGSSAL